MEATLLLSLYGVGLLGALRQSLLASLAVSLVIGLSTASQVALTVRQSR